VGVAGKVPYRIETERLVIRPYDPRDAPILKETVERSREHLWPWMDWTPAEPEPLEDVVERLRSFRAQFDADENWIMGAWSKDQSRLLAGTGLHPRGGEGSLEIGYWVAVDAIGQGIATEMAAVLARVCVELLDIDRVDLQIEPTNERSANVARKLGFTYEGTLRRRLPRREGLRGDSMVFTLLREELPGSPCMAYAYTAYDVLGNQLA
jgi:RimJ/RimL family protein N-acetyltransferase